jgi:hypothetical protein
MQIAIYTPQPIKEDSWLHNSEHKWFRDGYAYASAQTKTIPALASVTPEDIHYALMLILRGAKREGHRVSIPEEL